MRPILQVNLEKNEMHLSFACCLFLFGQSFKIPKLLFNLNFAQRSQGTFEVLSLKQGNSTELEIMTQTPQIYAFLTPCAQNKPEVKVRKKMFLRLTIVTFAHYLMLDILERLYCRLILRRREECHVFCRTKRSSMKDVIERTQIDQQQRG